MRVDWMRWAEGVQRGWVIVVLMACAIEAEMVLNRPGKIDRQMDDVVMCLRKATPKPALDQSLPTRYCYISIQLDINPDGHKGLKRAGPSSVIQHWPYCCHSRPGGGCAVLAPAATGTRPAGSRCGTVAYAGGGPASG